MTQSANSVTKRPATPPPQEDPKARRIEDPVTQAAQRGITPPPQDAPKARRIESKDWASPEMNGLFKTLPHLLQKAVNPTELVQLQFLIGEGEYYPVLIPKFILANLPHFEDIFSKGWAIEAQTNTFHIQPLTPPAYFHPRAIAFIAQNLQADYKIFKDKQTLSELRDEFPKEKREEFDVILNDVIRLARHINSEEILRDCVRFVADEMQSGDDEKLCYLDWSLTHSPDFMCEVIPLLSRERASFFRVLSELAEAKFPENAAQKKQILKTYFRLALPDYTKATLRRQLHFNSEVVLAVCDCVVKLFPHFDMPEELFSKFLPKNVQLLNEFLKRPWQAEQRFLLAAVVNFCKKGNILNWDIPLTTFPEKLKEYRLLTEGKLDEALAINPRNVRALIDKANACNCNFAESIALVTSALEIEPEYLPALHRRGHLYYHSYQYELALKDFSTCLEIDPNDSWAFDRRADVHSSMGHIDAAIKDYTMSLGIDRNNSTALERRAQCYLKKGNAQAALADLAEYSSREEDKDNNYFRKLGDCYRLLGDIEKAIAIYTEILYEGSEEPHAALYRGECYYRLGKLNEAIADFTDRLSLKDNEDEKAFSKRGDCYRQQGKTIAALKDFQSCLALEPKDEIKAFVLARRADCYLQLGNLDEALRDAQACLALKSDDSTRAFALARLGWCHLKKNELNEALKCLNESFLLAPNDVSTLIIRGECLLKREDAQAAFKDFNFCLSVNPTPFVVGECHRLMGKREEAIRAYSQAILSESHHIPALLRRAECFRLNRQLLGTREDLKKAAEIDKDLAGQLQEAIEKIEKEICQPSQE